MKRFFWTLICLCATLTVVRGQTVKVYDEQIDPMMQIDQAVSQAASGGKYVICQVGGNWCRWCLMFADFIQKDAEIAQVINDNYIYIHVNYVPRKSSPKLMERLDNAGRFGYPVLVVLRQDGTVLHIQDSSLLEEGNGYNRKKVLSFFKNWTPTAVSNKKYNNDVKETTDIERQTLSIFQRPLWVSLFALTAAIVWGWAYPLIKLGFAEFGIAPSMTGSKMLFAGIRFFCSGLIILCVAGSKGKSFRLRKNSDWWYVLLFSLLNTTFHYAFFYFGLSHSEGSRAAILNSISVFMVVILACVFFKSDRMTIRKVIGCVMGFMGILALNLGGKESGHFTWLGDGMIILNATCSAFAALMTRGIDKRVDVFVGTGYSLSLGGLLLVIPGILAGGTLPHVTFVGIIILLLLCGCGNGCGNNFLGNNCGC